MCSRLTLLIFAYCLHRFSNLLAVTGSTPLNMHPNNLEHTILANKTTNNKKSHALKNAWQDRHTLLPSDSHSRMQTKWPPNGCFCNRPFWQPRQLTVTHPNVKQLFSIVFFSLTQVVPISELGDGFDGIKSGVLGQRVRDDFQRLGISPETILLHSG